MRLKTRAGAVIFNSVDAVLVSKPAVAVVDYGGDLHE